MPRALSAESAAALRARLGFLRELGIYDLYRRGSSITEEDLTAAEQAADQDLHPDPDHARDLPQAPTPSATVAVTETPEDHEIATRKRAQPLSPPSLFPGELIAPASRATALAAIREQIGDCTRCPLAFAGRHTIVFGDGNPNARLLFVGEGPGADEDAQGIPFIGKAGQLLNNMITAMGLTREQVYIANIVKCRPPGNRVPEPVEANTCTPFLFEQIGVIRPEIVVALGSTAATYLLGGKSPLSALRGRVHAALGAKLIVTYHPAYLLRDPRQKKEAWADLQIAIRELAAGAH